MNTTELTSKLETLSDKLSSLIAHGDINGSAHIFCEMELLIIKNFKTLPAAETWQEILEARRMERNKLTGFPY